MRIIATLLAALLLFSACTEDPEPKEPKKSSTPKPTATAPTLPPEAKADTEAGAVAFVKHYIDVFNYASNTGDVKQLQALSDPKCEGCTSYIGTFQKTYADGGYFKDGDWTLSELVAEEQGRDMVVFAHVEAPGGNYKLSSKSEERPGDEEDVDVTFIPRRSGSGWKLGKFGLRPDE